MQLESHSNDTSRQAEGSIGWFVGRNVALLVIGMAIFVALVRILVALYIDWFIAIPFASLPLACITAFAWFTRGKPKSWISDLVWFYIWKFKAWLYMSGCLDRAPVLWGAARNKPSHPEAFR